MRNQSKHRRPPDPLMEFLSDAVARRYGREQVRGLERKPSEFTSSYDADIVTVSLVDGRSRQLFLKDFTTCRYEKDGARQARECLVYSDLLADKSLGTAECYGVGRDDHDARVWLLLEYIDGVRVKYCEFDDWVSAASWLGAMQAVFATESPSLRRRGYLLRYDEEFYLSTAEQADRTVSRISRELRSRLAAVLNRYRRLIPLLTTEPVTLIHGGYRPQNIMVVRSGSRRRIVAVDWEEAGLGSPFHDLAYLGDGFTGPRRLALLQAHHASAAAGGLLLPADEEGSRLLACFQLHKNLATLAKALDRRFPSRATVNLLGMLEALTDRVVAPPSSSARSG